MTAVQPGVNPFPGLRPFEANEDHLFFGRETQVDQLLKRLGSTRFLAVVGTSGCGKSSLVRCGLIPSLESGFMVSAGSSWRIALLHPGEDPIGNLAAALNHPAVIGPSDGAAGGDTAEVLVDVTLRRGSRGLIDAVRESRIPAGENLLVIVDQFEELFRFRRSRQIENSRDEAIAFVKLLTDAANQDELPIYVALTMRSDFIGDCMEYPGLPEMVNDGQYLVPRMTREELRLAITGPVAVGGGTIAPRLVQRLLNEFGDDPDQLPVLQHALMRTWDHWTRAGHTEEPIDLADYEAIGTMREALSRHAEEAFAEAEAVDGGRIVRRLFKALTDTFSDPRGVRRPATIHEVAAIAGASDADVIHVVDVFRQPGRSFLTPAAVVLAGPSIVDLSHESLMRRWERLIEWTREETSAAMFYTRLSQAAAWFAQGTAALWRNPELQLAERWRAETAPTPAWAERYNDAFEPSIAFLDESQAAWDQARAERERERRRELHRTRLAAVVLAILLFIAGGFAIYAFQQKSLAAGRLRIASDAIQSSLLPAGQDLEQPGAADSPDLKALRQRLLTSAESTLPRLQSGDQLTEDLQRQDADTQLNLGHINRMLGASDAAKTSYNAAIVAFQRLVDDYGASIDRSSLAASYTWLGETLRGGPAEGWPAAAEADDHALTIVTALRAAEPADTSHDRDYARVLDNRAILRFTQAMAADATLARPDAQTLAREAEADFRQAIAMLESIHTGRLDMPPALDLARAYSNLGNLLRQRGQTAEAAAAFQRAIDVGGRLVTSAPDNREYQFELAQFNDNLALLLGGTADALAPSQRAAELLDGLRSQNASVGLEAVKAHLMQARAQHDAPSASLADYREAVDLFQQFSPNLAAADLNSFHAWSMALLVDLARFRPASDSLTLLDQALNVYVSANESLAAREPTSAAQTLNSAINALERRAGSLDAANAARFRTAEQQLKTRLDAINAGK